MENKEKNLKRKMSISKKVSKVTVTKYRNSISVSSFHSRQFPFFNNNIEKIKYEDDKSSSNSISSNISNQKSQKSYNSSVKSNIKQYNLVSNPVSELSRASSVIIKVEYQDCCCINFANNLYNVFTKNKDNIKYLFKATELQACIDYSLCQFYKNPFVLNIEHVISIGIETSGTKFATAQKSCKFPCLCYCRPELEVKMGQSQKSIGKIVAPFSCGDTKYIIYSDKKQLKFIIDTDYCQYGIICPKNCCGYFPEVFFDIFNDKYEKIGRIERIPGQYKEFMHVLDCYQVIFPKKVSVENKMLLICSTFMIESEIFRDKWGSMEYSIGCDCNCCNEENCGYCLLRCCGECLGSCLRC